MSLAGGNIQRNPKQVGWDSWLAGVPLNRLNDREERAGWLAADDSYGAVGIEFREKKDQEHGKERSSNG